MEKIKCTYIADEYFLEIIPEEVLNNSSYDIRVKNIKSKNGKKIDNLKFTITTELTPSYCSLEGMRSLTEVFDIPESRILYFIRESSKHADFIMGGNALDKNGEVPFAVEQFVKIRTSIEALTRAYMGKAISSGEKGKVDEVEYETKSSFTGLNDLLDFLKGLLKYWLDAMQGYYNEGKAAPVSTRMSLKSEYNFCVPLTTSEFILDNYTRTLQRS